MIKFELLITINIENSNWIGLSINYIIKIENKIRKKNRKLLIENSNFPVHKWYKTISS